MRYTRIENAGIVPRRLHCHLRLRGVDLRRLLMPAQMFFVSRENFVQQGFETLREGLRLRLRCFVFRLEVGIERGSGSRCHENISFEELIAQAGRAERHAWARVRRRRAENIWVDSKKGLMLVAGHQGHSTVGARPANARVSLDGMKFLCTLILRSMRSFATAEKRLRSG